MKDYGKYAGGVGLILILVALGSYYVSATLDWFETALLIAGLAGVVFFVVTHMAEIRDLMFRRSTKYTANAVTSAVVVLGILGLINFIASEHNWRLDTTAAKQFSLSDQTIKVLKNLNDDLNITAFYKAEDQQEMQDLLKEYANISPKVKYEFIDPDKKPAIARQYGITSYGTTVIEYRGRDERITTSTEQDLTNAIIKVTREKQKKIYFTTGHGEKNIDIEDERNGMSGAKSVIEEKNYLVESVLLVEKGQVPDDCDVLVIAGPTKPFLPNELEMVENYLNQGGAVYLLLDPAPSPGFEDLAAKWGLKVGNDVVVDVSGIGMLFGAGANMPVAAQYNDTHPITEKFGNFMTAFPLARSVTPMDEPPADVDVDWLAKTTERSWGETNLSNGKAELNPDEDLLGPVTIAAVATKTIEVSEADSASANGESDGNSKETTAKLAIVGDSDFASNAFFNFQANGDLFMNTLSWLAEEEDLVSIRPKSPEDRRINLTQKQSRIMLLLGVILVPMAVLAMAVVVQRRRQ
ncbi:MAG: Gldg family protein [candidate division KSB1 bacterium]|nr:Gldg family protein [candidate division KSB1 bacterium]